MPPTSTARSAHPVACAQRGFTLIELVVAMVIAGILVAVAIPAYSSYVRKARRTDAKTALLDLASLEERYYSTANAYTNDPTKVGYAGSAPMTNQTVGSGYYQVSIASVTAATATATATYTLTAVPVGDQTKDTSCASFQVIQTGAQSSLNSGGTDSTATCWK